MAAATVPRKCPLAFLSERAGGELAEPLHYSLHYSLQWHLSFTGLEAKAGRSWSAAHSITVLRYGFELYGLVMTVSPDFWLNKKKKAVNKLDAGSGTVVQQWILTGAYNFACVCRN